MALVKKNGATRAGPLVGTTSVTATASDMSLILLGNVDNDIASDFVGDLFKKSAADTTAAKEQALNSKSINKKPPRDTADVLCFVPHVFMQAPFGNPTGKKTPKYTLLVKTVLRRPETDKARRSDRLTLTVSPYVAWVKTPDSGVPKDPNNPLSLSPLAQVQYCVAYMDYLRSEAEKNTEDPSVLDSVIDLLEAAALEKNVRREYLPACTLRNVPFYAPNVPKKPEDGKAKKTTTAADNNTKKEGKEEGGGSVFVPHKTMKQLKKVVPLYLTQEPVANAVVLLLHAYATAKEAKTFTRDTKIQCKHYGSGAPLAGYGELRIYGLKYSVRIEANAPEVITDRRAYMPKLTHYFAYENHEIEETYPDALFKRVSIEQQRYETRLSTLAEYKLAAANPDDKIVLNVLVVPKHRAHRLMNLPSGIALSIDLAPGVSMKDEGVLKTAKTAKQPQEHICFRGLITGPQWQATLVTKHKEEGNPKPYAVSLNAQAVYLRPVIYSDHLGPAFGFDGKDTGRWEQFAPILLRSCEMLLSGTVAIPGSEMLVANERHFPRVITRDAAAAFDEEHRRDTPGPDGFPVLDCGEKDVATALKLIEVGYGQRPVILELFVDKVLNDMPQLLKECGLPVTKEVAIKIYTEYVGTKAGVGAKCSDTNVHHLSIQNSTIDSFDEAKFDFYAVSSAATAKDLATIRTLTKAHTTVAFSPNYLDAPSMKEQMKIAEAAGVASTVDFICLAPGNITNADYLIYAVSRKVATADAAKLQRLKDFFTSSGNVEEEEEEEVVDEETPAITNGVEGEDAESSSVRNKKRARATIEEEEEEEATPAAKRSKPGETTAAAAAPLPPTLVLPPPLSSAAAAATPLPVEEDGMAVVAAATEGDEEVDEEEVSPAQKIMSDDDDNDNVDVDNEAGDNMPIEDAE